MKTPQRWDDAVNSEKAQTKRRKRPMYILRLYVAGATARSARTILTIKTTCEEHLADQYDLRVIDIYQQPYLAREEQIVAVPLLVKQEPEPVRRFIGDLSDDARLLAGLDLPVKEAL